MSVSKQRKDHKKKLNQRKENIIIQKKRKQKQINELIAKYNEQKESSGNISFQDNFRTNFPNSLNKNITND